MVRRRGSTVFLFFALVPGLTLAIGQAAVQSPPQTNQVAAAASAVGAPVKPAIPKDLRKLMLLGWQLNGIEGVDRPWHLKAAYQTFDADGKPTGSGTFEEWWASPEKWKWSFS